MHDVVREVVLAVGDEDLLAVQPKAPVRLRHRARPHRRKVRAGLRFREVHRAGPFAAHELGQVAALLRVGAAQLQRLDGAVREHGAQCEGDVGAVPHLLDQCRDHARQSLSAVFRMAGERVPAAFGEVAICIPPPARRPNRVLRPPAALAITDHVQRGQHAVRELARLLQDGHGEIQIDFVEVRQGRELAQRRNLLQDELHVLQRGKVFAHVAHS